MEILMLYKSIIDEIRELQALKKLLDTALLMNDSKNLENHIQEIKVIASQLLNHSDELRRTL